jgi:hypothetical protein
MTRGGLCARRACVRAFGPPWRQATNRPSDGRARCLLLAQKQTKSLEGLLLVCARTFERSAVSVLKSDSISSAYEKRTKSAKSRGLEKESTEEPIGDVRACKSVNRSEQNARQFRTFCMQTPRQRTLLWGRLAERAVSCEPVSTRPSLLTGKITGNC